MPQFGTYLYTVFGKRIIFGHVRLDRQELDRLLERLRGAFDSSPLMIMHRLPIEAVDEAGMTDRERAERLQEWKGIEAVVATLCRKPNTPTADDLKWLAVTQAAAILAQQLAGMLEAGELHQGDAHAAAGRETGTDAVTPSDNARLTCGELAHRFDVDVEPLRKRLERWRKHHDRGYVENPDAASREARFLYEVSAVKPTIDEMKKRPASVRQKKIGP